MSHVSGPTSSLPNSSHMVPEGTMCDNHENMLAVKRLQGETDSFGAEYHDLCKECIDEHNAIPRDDSGCCDWCKNYSENLRHHRDFEEGFSGPVYRVCGVCITKESERCLEELEENRRFDDPYDDYDEPDPDMVSINPELEADLQRLLALDFAAINVSWQEANETLASFTVGKLKVEVKKRFKETTYQIHYRGRLRASLEGSLLSAMEQISNTSAFELAKRMAILDAIPIARSKGLFKGGE